MTEYLELYKKFDPPFDHYDPSILGPEFPAELDLVSRLWFKCGYRPGIGAYLNFFLLRDFITTHDTAFPPRFKSFKSMSMTFYQTDLFIRHVTDSGARPTGGISNPKVHELLRLTQHRHKKIKIPLWMETYFGISLLENVEQQCAPLTDEEKRLHLAYMSKTYRIMGFPFTQNRELIEKFSQQIEYEQAAITQNVEKHATNILRLAEMIGVSSSLESIAEMLPARTRREFESIYPKVRPWLPRRVWLRVMGKLFMPKAMGKPRKAVPFVG